MVKYSCRLDIGSSHRYEREDSMNNQDDVWVNHVLDVLKKLPPKERTEAISSLRVLALQLNQQQSDQLSFDSLRSRDEESSQVR